MAKHMLGKAVEWKMIADNPFRGVRNLGVPKRDERVLSADEEVTLLAACDRARSRLLRPLVVLALNTRMRRGELLGQGKAMGREQRDASFSGNPERPILLIYFSAEMQAIGRKVMQGAKKARNVEKYLKKRTT